MKRLAAMILLLVMLAGCEKPVHKPVNDPPQTDPPVPVTEIKMPTGTAGAD